MESVTFSEERSFLDGMRGGQSEGARGFLSNLPSQLGGGVVSCRGLLCSSLSAASGSTKACVLCLRLCLRLCLSILVCHLSLIPSHPVFALQAEVSSQ
jgi:hypothetical protein